jgi:hypothetical protein
MGLEKRKDFDHGLESVLAAAGYSEETAARELQPRAALLAFNIMDMAGTCPTMAIELLMSSPLLDEPGLDNRDRAMIILMAGPVLAANIVKQAMDDPEGLRKACVSSHGYEHNSGKEQYEVLNLSREKWDDLVSYSENKVFGGQKSPKASELVENLEKLLDDRELSSLDKAILEGFVVKRSVLEVADGIAPHPAAVGPLAAR